MNKQWNDTEFDSFVKGKIQNLDSEVPADFWNEIDQQLPAPKSSFLQKHKIGISIGAITVAIAAAAAVYVSTGQKKEAQEKPSTTKASTVISKSSLDSIITKEENIVPEKLSANTNPMSADKQANTIKAANRLNLNLPSSKFEPEPLTFVEERPITVLDVNQVTLPSNNEESTPSEYQQANSSTINLDKNTLAPIDDENVDKTSQAVEETQKEVEKIVAVLPSDSTVKKNEESSKQEETKVPRAFKPWSFSVNFAPTYTYRLTLSEDEDYFNAYEYGSFAYNANVKVHYQLNKSLRLATGLGYEMYAMKTEVPLNNVNLLTEEEQFYFYASYGYVPFDLEDIQGVSGMYKTNVQLHNFTVPLQIDYLFAKSYFASAAVNYSYLFADTNDAHIGGFEIEPGLAYLRRHNYGIVLSVGKEIDLHKGLSLLINPEFRIRLNSLIDDGDYIKSFPYMMGLNVGLKY